MLSPRTRARTIDPPRKASGRRRRTAAPSSSPQEHSGAHVLGLGRGALRRTGPRRQDAARIRQNGSFVRPLLSRHLPPDAPTRRFYREQKLREVLGIRRRLPAARFRRPTTQRFRQRDGADYCRDSGVDPLPSGHKNDQAFVEQKNGAIVADRRLPPPRVWKPRPLSRLYTTKTVRASPSFKLASKRRWCRCLASVTTAGPPCPKASQDSPNTSRCGERVAELSGLAIRTEADRVGNKGGHCRPAPRRRRL